MSEDSLNKIFNFVRWILEADEYRHVLHVVRNCRILAAGYDADPDVLVAAACFHDTIGPSKDANGTMDTAIRFLRDAGFPEEKIPRVAEVTRVRLLSEVDADSDTIPIEAKILCDADNLERVGSLYVAEMLMRMGKLWDFLDREGLRIVVDFISQRLAEHYDSFYTPEARREAQEAYEGALSFLRNIVQELEVETA
ncbi:MAG: HD domain-containing protein [bacterium]